jgi:hypothetical protein
MGGAGGRVILIVDLISNFFTPSPDLPHQGGGISGLLGQSRIIFLLYSKIYVQELSLFNNTLYPDICIIIYHKNSYILKKSSKHNLCLILNALHGLTDKSGRGFQRRPVRKTFLSM